MTVRFMRPAGRAASVPGQNPADQDLLDAVAAGCRSALKELFDRHGGAVHHLASVLSPGMDDADRVVEEVFVTLWRRGGRLEDEVDNVGLGLLAMARRRSRPGPDPAAISGPRSLRAEEREAIALTQLATAMLTDVAVVLQQDRRVVGSRLRAGLRAARSA